MKRLTRRTSKTAIIIPEIDQKTYEEFKNKLFTALRKFGSGRKTKAVHKIIDKNMVIACIFAGDASVLIGAPTFKETTLRSILLNAHLFDDSVMGTGTIKMAGHLVDLEKQLKKEETFVNEAR
jgi:hypothetical protein